MSKNGVVEANITSKVEITCPHCQFATIVTVKKLLAGQARCLSCQAEFVAYIIDGEGENKERKQQ